MLPLVRTANADETSAVCDVQEAAFPAKTESCLVKLLIDRGKAPINLLAEIDGSIAGHVLCSDVVIDGHEESKLLALGPLAVMPSAQGRGVGAALVSHAIAQARVIDASAVVLLGDPRYYARFGFQPALPYGLTNAYGVEHDAWQICVLDEACLAAVHGMVRFRPEFEEVGVTAS